MLEDPQRHVRTQVPQEKLHILVDQQGARIMRYPQSRARAARTAACGPAHAGPWPVGCSMWEDPYRHGSSAKADDSGLLRGSVHNEAPPELRARRRARPAMASGADEGVGGCWSILTGMSGHRVL